MKPIRLNDERQIKYLDQSEVRRFFAAIPEDNTRDRLLFGFIYRYGMRTIEACELPVTAIDMVRREVKIRGAKNGLFRIYPIFPDMLPLVKKWLEERDPEAPEFFTGTRGGFTRQWVFKLFKKYAAAGRVKLEPGKAVHSLRHSAAVHALDAGATQEDVRDLLRHRSIDSTLVYAELSTKRRNGYLAMLQGSREVVKV